MFTLNEVTLRSLEYDDIDTLYAWNLDIQLEMLAGWGQNGRVQHIDSVLSDELQTLRQQKAQGLMPLRS